MHAYYLGCAVLLFQITGSTYINIENKLTFTEKGTPQKTNLVAEVTVRRSSVPRFFFLAFFFSLAGVFSHTSTSTPVFSTLFCLLEVFSPPGIFILGQSHSDVFRTWGFSLLSLSHPVFSSYVFPSLCTPPLCFLSVQVFSLSWNVLVSIWVKVLLMLLYGDSQLRDFKE